MIYMLVNAKIAYFPKLPKNCLSPETSEKVKNKRSSSPYAHTAGLDTRFLVIGGHQVTKANLSKSAFYQIKM
jgi:hypothetical protein